MTRLRKYFFYLSGLCFLGLILVGCMFGGNSAMYRNDIVFCEQCFQSLPRVTNRIVLNYSQDEIKSFVLPDSTSSVSGNLVYYSIKNNGNHKIFPNVSVNGSNFNTNDSLLQLIIGNSPINDEEKAKRIYQFVFDNRKWGNRLLANSELSNPVYFFNLGGFGVCTDFSRVMAILLQLSNIESRIVHIGGEHAVVEAYYDKSWHMFDPSVGVYFTNEIGKIIDTAKVQKNPQVINQVVSVFHRDVGQKSFLQEVFLKNSKTLNFETSDSFMKLVRKDNFVYELDPGDEIRFYTHWADKNIFANNKADDLNYTNGLLMRNIRSSSLLASKTIRNIHLPYLIVGAYMQKSKCEVRQMTKISLDEVEWKWPDKCHDGIMDFSSYFWEIKSDRVQFEYSVSTNYQTITTYTQFQFGERALPVVHNGDNTVELHGLVPGDNVTVELAF